jgi:hypothetical protein
LFVLLSTDLKLGMCVWIILEMRMHTPCKTQIGSGQSVLENISKAHAEEKLICMQGGGLGAISG